MSTPRLAGVALLLLATLAQAQDPIEVMKADFDVVSRDPYTWRLGYQLRLKNNLGRPVKVILTAFFEDWGGKVLQHGKALETTLMPGISEFSGYSGLSAELAREVTRVRPNIMIVRP